MRNAAMLAATITLMSFTPVPASAADMSNMMQTISGNVGGWSDFDSRKADLQKAIDAGVLSNQLTAAQATELKNQIDALTASEVQVRAGRRGLMSFVDSLSFNNRLNALAAQVESAMNQHVASLPDIDKMHADLKRRVDANAASGRILGPETASLKSDLDNVSRIETAFKAETGGNLTPRQIDVVAGELNKVKAKIDEQEKLAQSGIPVLNERRATLESKISKLQSGSKLTASDAANLKVQLDAIAQKQNSYAAGGSLLTGVQVLQLAQELDAVDAKIDARLVAATTVAAPVAIAQPGSPNEDIDQKLRQADIKLGRLQRAGGAPPDVVNDYKRQLDQIAQQEARYQLAPNGMTAGQSNELRSSLDTILRMLNQRIAATAQADVGVNDRGPANIVGGDNYSPRDNYLGRDNHSGRDSYSGRDNYSGPNNYSGSDSYSGRDNYPPSRTSDDSTGDGGTYVPRLPRDRNPRDQNQLGSMPPGRDGLYTNTRNYSDTAPSDINSSSNPMNDQQGSSGPAKSFADLGGYWGQQYVETLAGRGVIGGFPNGTFHPNENITRAQFAAIVAQALKLPDVGGGTNFTDVKASHWAGRAIGNVSNAGLITGFPDGSFRPEDQLTRAQALVILSKALKSGSTGPSGLERYTDSQAVPSWAQESIAKAANARIIVNFPDAAQIRPNALATRGEVAAMMYQALSTMGNNLPRVTIGVLSKQASASTY